jgi:shikimate dehydrogenase
MNPIKAGVIGHPIAHSKSPLIHTHWIKEYGLNGSYTAIDIPCESLAQDVTHLINEGFSGFNVTLPHKVAIMQICNSLDPLAKTVGAVNTVTIKNGKLHGTNTDVFGFIQNIKSSVPQFFFTKGPALILGAGGAARAIVQGLLQEGVPEIRIANRTQSNADQLLKHCTAPSKIKIIPWDERDHQKHLQDITLLVNTTSLGMNGKLPLDITLTHLPPTALVHDIVYAPLMTDLLKQAQPRGNPIVTGIGMLLHQARPAFQSWFDILPDVTPELERIILS